MSYIGKIPANAVLTTADLADGIVTAAKIEDGTVNAKLATERAAEIEATLNNIVKQIEVVKEVTDTVSTNTNEQSLAIQEVTTNIVNIYDKANDNVTSAQQIYQATVNIEESAESMEKSIKQYKVK